MRITLCFLSILVALCACSQDENNNAITAFDDSLAAAEHATSTVAAGPVIAAHQGGEASGSGSANPSVLSGPSFNVAEAETRIDAALLWLAHHQSSSGSWEPGDLLKNSLRSQRAVQGFISTGNVDFKHELGPEQIGRDEQVTALTGLALIAFAAEGHTHKVGHYAQTVRQGVKWILAHQWADGCFGPQTNTAFTYAHAFCTFALCELFAQSRDNRIRRSAQLGVDFIREAQNPGMGWRFGVKPGDNDTDITTWMILTMKSAEVGGLDVLSKEMFSGANAFLDSMLTTGSDGRVRTNYRRSPSDPKGALSEFPSYPAHAATMNENALLIRHLTQHITDLKDPRIQGLLHDMLVPEPKWKIVKDARGVTNHIDMQSWLVRTMALAHVGGASWKEWSSKVIDPVLLRHQRGWHPADLKHVSNSVQGGASASPNCWELDEHGSWDPVGAWGYFGGRVYSTALNSITLSIALGMEAK